jgi:hypothetical protein
MLKSKKIKKFLFEHDLLKYKNKCIYAERAFMANSAVQWCLKKIDDDEFSQNQIDSFGKILMLYLEDKIDLSWQKGMLCMTHKTSNQP